MLQLSNSVKFQKDKV